MDNDLDLLIKLGDIATQIKEINFAIDEIYLEIKQADRKALNGLSVESDSFHIEKGGFIDEAEMLLSQQLRVKKTLLERLQRIKIQLDEQKKKN